MSILRCPSHEGEIFNFKIANFESITAQFLARKWARIYTRQVSRRHATVSGIGRPLYNEGLINRGNVTIWIYEAALARIPDPIHTRGRPRLIRRYA
ncbi:MAG: hypothetical protein E5299_02459 [Burkholderia gladioli]|nr:MAG: hypothetical protein E5299_02459 [Burkholderia gladioli]